MEKEKSIVFYIAETNIELSLDYVDGGIKAGFPSPAQDYLDSAIDLNKELVKHPESTFYGKIKGNSMQDARLYDGDIVVIDKSIRPLNGDIVVCSIDGEFTIKIFEREGDIIWLIPANPAYSRIKVTKDNDFRIWGVVTNSIIRHRK